MFDREKNFKMTSIGIDNIFGILGVVVVLLCFSPILKILEKDTQSGHWFTIIMIVITIVGYSLGLKFSKRYVHKYVRKYTDWEANRFDKLESSTKAEKMNRLINLILVFFICLPYSIFKITVSSCERPPNTRYPWLYDLYEAFKEMQLLTDSQTVMILLYLGGVLIFSKALIDAIIFTVTKKKYRGIVYLLMKEAKEEKKG